MLPPIKSSTPASFHSAPPSSNLSIPMHFQQLASKGIINKEVAASIVAQFKDHSSSDATIAKILYTSANFQTLPELNQLLRSNPAFAKRINAQVIGMLRDRGFDAQIQHSVLSLATPTSTGTPTASPTVYDVPRKADTVMEGHVDVSNGHTVLLTGSASADVYHTGNVHAFDGRNQVNVGYGGDATITNGARGVVNSGGRAMVNTGGQIELHDGSKGMVSDGGIAYGYSGSEVIVKHNGIAEISGINAIGKMDEAGNVTVTDHATVVATHGRTTVGKGGYAHGLEKAKLTILAGGEGRVENQASASANAGGHVTVGKDGMAYVRSGARGHAKAGGRLTAEGRSQISAEPGAQIQFLDPNMLVKCGTVMKKAGELENFGNTGTFTVITENDCAGSTDQSKTLKSILKKESDPPKTGPGKSVSFGVTLGVPPRPTISASDTTTQKPAILSARPLKEMPQTALAKRLAERLKGHGLTAAPVAKTSSPSQPAPASSTSVQTPAQQPPIITSGDV